MKSQRMFFRATENVIALLLLLLLPTESPAAHADWRVHARPTKDARIAPGRLLIKFTSRLDANLKASPNLQSLLGAGLQTATPLANLRNPQALVAGVDRLVSVAVDPSLDILVLARKLARLPEVEYAEPVLLYELVAVNDIYSAPRDDTVDGLAATPNDPAWSSGSQDNMSRLQLEAAWDVVTGASGSPVVCVIDGGSNWQHEDLNANMWQNPGEIPGNGQDDDNNGYIDDVNGWNFLANNGNVRGDWNNTPALANHGTHTAGLLAAVTNNGLGVASASWNPQLMVVNAGGANDNSIAFGYSGVLYAAQNGADIISLSWGGNSGSAALQDIIDFAVSQGVLVMGAAGNNNNDVPFFPAAYRGVFAVANVWGETDVRYSGGSGSCYGGWLDVAAPGAAVYSTFDFNATNAYGVSTGTSMSCPIAAAVAALIQSQHPTWGPLKVGEKLRVTCDNINALNPGFEDLLGRGRVNALRAVTESGPAVRAVSWTLADADGNGELNRGEIITVHLDLHNFLDAAISPMVQLSSSSSSISLLDASESFADLPEDGDITLPAAFQFQVAANAPPGEQIDLRLDFTATNYVDFQFLPAVLEPEYKTHDLNQLRVSLTSTGNIGWIGFAGGLAGQKGKGFQFAASPDLLFEGALLLGTSAANLSDAARTTSENSDFTTDSLVLSTIATPGILADQEIQAAFHDASNLSTPLGISVALNSFAYNDVGDQEFILLRYEIVNTGASTINGLRAGLFCDWDIDAVNHTTNRAAWDASRNLGYAWDTTDASLPYTGIQALNGNVVNYSAIRNDGLNNPINLHDGFSKDEKWLILSDGTGVTTAGPSDISNAISSGPWTLAPGDSAVAWFALLGGADLPLLQASADRALSRYQGLIVTSIAEGDDPATPGAQPPRRLALSQAVPNPFNPGTTLRLSVDRRQSLQVTIHDVRGYRVRTLLEGVIEPGEHKITWNGRNDQHASVASGVYFAKLQSRSGLQVRRLVLAH